MTDEQKTNISQRTFGILFIGLVLLALSGCTTASAQSVRERVMASASADVGVREATGHNDGPAVERYLAHVGLKPGSAWCAAFVSYHLSKEGVRNPNTGWSPAFSGLEDRVWTPRKASRAPLPGDVFTLYYPSLGRVGHVGFVAGQGGRYINTVEGNTSGPGSREGDGVYARRREMSKVHAITDYIKDIPGDRADRQLGATRLQEQAALRGYDRRGAARYASHRCATGYDDPLTWGKRVGARALAVVWRGPGTDDGALGARIQHGLDHQGRALAHRWVRLHESEGHGAGHQHGDRPHQGDGPDGDDHRDEDAAVGVLADRLRGIGRGRQAA